jgi:hypothetical protein
VRQFFLWLEIPAYKYFPTHLMERCGPKQWARLRILQACERLEIPVKLWPKFPFPVMPRRYNHFYRASGTAPLPDFFPLHESEAEWKVKAQSFLGELVEKELAGFRRKLESDLKTGFLTPIKQMRDTTPLELRYDWTAKRLCYRTPYAQLAKEEAAKGYTEARIKQTVGKIITEARWRQGL